MYTTSSPPTLMLQTLNTFKTLILKNTVDIRVISFRFCFRALDIGSAALYDKLYKLTAKTPEPGK